MKANATLTTPEDDAVIALLLCVCNSEKPVFGTFKNPAPELRERYQNLLELAVADRVALADQFLPIGIAVIESTRIKGTIVFGRRGFTLGYKHEFPTLESALNYGLMLLLDVSKPYGVMISRCHLSICQRFYIARQNPKGGPANRNYCSPAHRAKAHDWKENRKPRKSK